MLILPRIPTLVQPLAELHPRCSESETSPFLRMVSRTLGIYSFFKPSLPATGLSVLPMTILPMTILPVGFIQIARLSLPPPPLPFPGSLPAPGFFF